MHCRNSHSYILGYFVANGARASSFPRFTDTNAYRTSSLKLWKTRHKIYVDMQIFLTVCKLFTIHAHCTDCLNTMQMEMSSVNALTLWNCQCCCQIQIKSNLKTVQIMYKKKTKNVINKLHYISMIPEPISASIMPLAQWYDWLELSWARFNVPPNTV